MSQRTRPWWENFVRGLRHAYKKILRLKSSPHDIALGLSLGVFIGLLPIIPFQFITVLVLAMALRCSKLTALLGTLIANPLSIPFLYFIKFRLGCFFLPDLCSRYNPEHWSMSELLQTGWPVFGAMLLGGVLIGLPSAVVAYFLARYLMELYHVRRAKKIAGSPYKRVLPDKEPNSPPENNAP